MICQHLQRRYDLACNKYLVHSPLGEVPYLIELSPGESTRRDAEHLADLHQSSGLIFLFSYLSESGFSFLHEDLHFLTVDNGGGRI